MDYNLKIYRIKKHNTAHKPITPTTMIFRTIPSSFDLLKNI